jgi:hypothetical protein
MLDEQDRQIKRSQDLLQLLAGCAGGRNRYVDRGHDLAAAISDRGCHRAQARGQLLVVDGVTQLAHLVQFGHQRVERGDRVRPHLPVRALTQQVFEFLSGEVDQLDFAHTGAMDGQAGPQVQIGADDAGGFLGECLQDL